MGKYEIYSSHTQQIITDCVDDHVSRGQGIIVLFDQILGQSDKGLVNITEIK